MLQRCGLLLGSRQGWIKADAIEQIQRDRDNCTLGVDDLTIGCGDNNASI